MLGAQLPKKVSALLDASSTEGGRKLSYFTMPNSILSEKAEFK